MYNNSNTSLFSGLVAVVVVLVVIGVVVGLSLSGTDLVNFITNPTKAQILKNKSDLELEKAAFNFDQYQQREEAQTESEVAIAKAQTEAEIRLKFVWVEITRLAGYAIVFAITVAIMVGIYLFAVRIKAHISQAEVKTQNLPNDPWQDPTVRAMQIDLARKRERASRTANLIYQSPLPKPSNRFPKGNGVMTIYKN